MSRRRTLLLACLAALGAAGVLALPAVHRRPSGWLRGGPPSGGPPPSPAPAPPAPPVLTMIRLVIRDLNPDGPPSPPTVVYRAGSRLGRLEPEGRARTIAHMPDLWELDPSGRRAVHRRDPDPNAPFRVPLTPPPGLPELGPDFEAGREAEYLRWHGAREARREAVNGRDCVVYRVEAGAVTAEVFLAADGAPAKAVVSRGGRVLRAVVYEEYRAGLPLDLALFRVPDGVEVVEGEQGER